LIDQQLDSDWGWTKLIQPELLVYWDGKQVDNCSQIKECD